MTIRKKKEERKCKKKEKDNSKIEVVNNSFIQKRRKNIWKRRNWMNMEVLKRKFNRFIIVVKIKEVEKKSGYVKIRVKKEKKNCRRKTVSLERKKKWKRHWEEWWKTVKKKKEAYMKNYDKKKTMTM